MHFWLTRHFQRADRVPDDGPCAVAFTPVAAECSTDLEPFADGCSERRGSSPPCGRPGRNSAARFTAGIKPAARYIRPAVREPSPPRGRASGVPAGRFGGATR